MEAIEQEKIYLNDQYLIALGKVVINFAHLRNQVENIFIQFKVWTVEEGMKNFPKMTFDNLIKRVSKLMLEKFQTDPVIIVKMNEITGEAISANRERNDILHSEWLENSALKYMVKYDKKKGKIEDCKPNDIIMVAEHLWKVSILIIRFITDHSIEPNYGRRYGIFRGQP